MKKLLLMLVVVVLASFLFVGCIPGITSTSEPEPVLEAVALAELSEDKDTIEWSIVNVGDVFIREYTLTFEVEYPDVERDYVVITHEGEYLEVGAFEEGTVELATYTYGDEDIAPKSVSATWELFE